MVYAHLMLVTETHLPTQTAVIHVLPIGATHMDFLRSNAVVPVATYGCPPVSAKDPAPHPKCVAEVLRLHPGHEVSHLPYLD